MGRYTGATCRLWTMLVLTAGFFVAELVSGYLGNSIALLSDSFNMLSDLISLCVGLASGYLARRARGGLRATYGLARAEVVGALGNAVFLAALCFTIFVEAVLRLARPERVDDPGLVLVVGALGLAVNVVGLLIFQDCAAWLSCCLRARRPGGRPRNEDPALDIPGPAGAQDKGATVIANAAGDSLNAQSEPEETVKKKKSEALNIRGVLLHVMGDALGSVVVVVTATIFYALPLKHEEPCNWQCYIDPSLTIVMVIVILSSTFPLIKETAIVLLQMVPPGIDMEALMSKLSVVPGVSGVHEVHVWELVSGKAIATLHVRPGEDKARAAVDAELRRIFHGAGIHSVTIQFEGADPAAHADFPAACSSPCVSRACAQKLCCPPGALPLAHANGCAELNGDLAPETRRGPREPTDVAIAVSGPGGLGGDRAQVLARAPEDQRGVYSTHF